ncbi:MAG: 2,3-epoxybenzoyl-CoA dihydrolase [Gammaproteobacteria bacterium]|nr:2,3-epoxybenzoyl-CoA dihydrolase [Gammaproteobacteria bacterium]
MNKRIDFATHPDRYRHWKLEISPPIARLILDVDEAGGMFEGYELKLNTYDIGVDIELADAVQRLRFEHPEVKAVMITSAKPNTFCAGANIRMLAGATHVHKVNFCKFTNETRNAIEDATEHSRQSYVAAINGTAAGGGYELALAAHKILIVDDGYAAVSLPEVPLLAVLPGTGGLTRVVDKRKVRRDIADHFCTLEEGMRGERAVRARLVDEAIPRSAFEARCEKLVRELAASSDRPDASTSVVLSQLDKTIEADSIEYSFVSVRLNREGQHATLEVRGPTTNVPRDASAAEQQGAQFWPLAMMRELDDAVLELRFNEPELGTIFLKTCGAADRVAAYDNFLEARAEHWFVREVNLHTRRVLKRLDLTSRSMFALIEPGSCFAGILAEIAFAADRSFMLEGQFEDRDDNAPIATLCLTPGNFGRYPTVNGLTRLEIRFLGEPETLQTARTLIGKALAAEAAADAGLVTTVLDDIDWKDELRLLTEARVGFSPDALTGMEANLRFPGPETMESKIFARLTAWQNWIFQRPNAVGPNGALTLYGTGRRPEFDKTRV